MDLSLYQLLSFLTIFSVPLFLLLLFKPSTKGHLPPGPRKLPIIGNLHQLGSMPHRSLHELATKHGPLMYLKLGSIPTLVISSSDVAQQVFKSHDAAFSGRPPLYAIRKLSYGFLDMAFAPYGEYWRQLRKISVLELLSPKRVQSFRRVREEDVALLIDSIERASVRVDLSEVMLTLSNNVVRRVMFGDGHAGSGHREEGNQFNEVLRVTQSLLGGFCVADFFPGLAWIHGFTGLERRLDKNFEELDGFYEQAIDEHSNKINQHHEVEDLVDVLLRLQKDPRNGNVFSSKNHIKGLITDMFIAGTDTSAATIVWTMTELMRNPMAMTKVQQELRTVIGNKARVQEHDLEHLHYLKLAIKESLRVHPPAPLLVPRETIEECNINGYVIPSKTRVFINARAISMDPRNWENPTEFWPERFLGVDIDYRGQDFNLIPFGFGRRGCPGVNFAVSLVELALANLLHCFDWSLPSGMEIEDLDTDEAFGLTKHKKNPLCLVPKHKLSGFVYN